MVFVQNCKYYISLIHIDMRNIEKHFYVYQDNKLLYRYRYINLDVMS